MMQTPNTKKISYAVCSPPRFSTAQLQPNESTAVGSPILARTKVSFTSKGLLPCVRLTSTMQGIKKQPCGRNETRVR